MGTPNDRRDLAYIGEIMAAWTNYQLNEKVDGMGNEGWDPHHGIQWDVSQSMPLICWF